jgi:hypothetical protein
MDAAKFKSVVMERLPFIANDDDFHTMSLNCETLHGEGYTVDEAVAYLSCCELISPDLDEDVALERMKSIREQVETRNI